MSDSPIYLIDGHAYIFRAHFAIKSMNTPREEPCAAAYGFFSSLIRFLGERRPQYAAIAFDFDVKNSFRQDIDPEYKANRESADDDLKRQFGWCFQGAEALGFPIFVERGFEADDLMGTLSAVHSEEGRSVVLMSPDKDLGQLVGPNVIQMDLGKDVRIDADAIEARWGVPPQRLPDVFGLVGDAIDNIPGVRGIGPKTARALVATYGTLEEIPRDPKGAEDLTLAQRRRAGTLLHENMEVALRSRELARIRTDMNLDGALSSLEWKPQPDAFVDLCDHLGFHRLKERFAKLLK